MDIDVTTINRQFDLISQAIQDSNGRISKSGSKWYSGSCPFCGGDDRFVIKIDNQGDPKWLCRQCGDGKYHDGIDYVQRRDNIGFVDACNLITGGILGNTIDYQEIESQRLERDKQRQQEIDIKLAQYTTQEIWEAYHRRLQDVQRDWYRSQGIPDDWQDYLRLGYTEDRGYYDKSKTLKHSPAYVIPYFLYDVTQDDKRRLRTIQYRLVNTDDPNDRYRFETDLGTSFYDPTPTTPIDDMVVITEGAKKAIVTQIHTGSGITVLGIPSKTDYGGVVDIVKQVGKVWIVLDPDAWVKPHHAGNGWIPSPVNLARKIGDQARIVDIPVKVDDAFIGGMSRSQWINYLRQGYKA